MDRQTNSAGFAWPSASDGTAFIWLSASHGSSNETDQNKCQIVSKYNGITGYMWHENCS